MKILFASACILLSTLFFHVNVSAQALGTATPSSALSVSITQAKDLSISTGANAVFNFTTIASLDDGIESENAVSLIYKSNKPWVLSVRANSATFTGSSATPMPVSVVQYKVNGTSSYRTLTPTDEVVLGTEGTRGTSTINLDYKVSPGFTYDPAEDYSLTITYTLSDQ